MLQSIYTVLEGLGLSSQKRALHLRFSNEILNSQVLIQRIEGRHWINEGLHAELLCLSTHPYIALKQFIGCQVAVDQVTDQGKLFRTTGIITAAKQGHSDGALSVYQLTLEDATSLWHKRRNSRVFLNKSIKAISEILFTEWQKRSGLFAKSLSLDLSGLNREYDVRPLVIQSNESDYDFLTRLWRSEGINWLIDEKELIIPISAQTIQPQVLRLVNGQQYFQALKRRSIRFHRSHATEQFDTITSLIAERQLVPNSVALQRWQAIDLEQEQNQQLVNIQQSSVQDHTSLSLEDVWNISPAWTSDLKREDQATSSSPAQLDQLSQQLSHYHAMQSKYFKASSSVRDAQVGYWFELHDHPEIDQHPHNEREFLILGKHFYNQNNLPKDLLLQLDQLMQSSHWKVLDDERQGNELYLIRRDIPVIPKYHPLQHRPMAYPQRAKVVGPEGETIYVDEWGRVKVRFLFTRSEDHQHDGGAGANDNDTDSVWVDVLTPWAGEGYGARFHLRIGEIVVIDFFEGDIDRPFIVGRIHEAERYQTMFDKKGQLPFTKKLSGIRSQEVDGEGFNQIRFDDTTGQISAQLQSSHGASQLNLGNLSHPKEDEASDGRGEGFELRTDQWGALRAGAGLLLSTYKQENANANHLNTSPAKSQLESNLNHSKALSEIAKNQQTDPLEGLDHLKKFLDQIEQQDQSKAETFKQALMLLCAPNSIALSTNEDLYLSADQQINHSAADNINFSTRKSLIAHAQDKISLFAAQQGLKAVAAKGKVELQAQDDAIETIARHKVKIISTEDRIEIISPKEIVLTAGGSQLKINGQGVFGVTGGKFECKAGQHIFKEGAKTIYEIPELPKSGPYAVDFLFNSLGGSGIEGAEVTMFIPENKEILWEGKTDSNGKTQLSISQEWVAYEALVGFKQWSNIFEDLDTKDLEEEFDVGEHGIQIEDIQ
ncbi:type VI secretion system Vgr family protein [Acinetobacter variabilis]|uniref:Type VI secretion system tip protein VgrG n=1 Tax=Acinetobacter variabilis TaxID=70346 RepID=N9P8C2_9GAMM|nr:type VI secretion system Vgr family protein [Acinetobacter variabilis]ENX11067.1 hypothetical protein F897_00753 [Acinetobacter variabilis]UBI29605.1 type VI secretion system tip protein VgrG [Acinetobacter variabilis]